jgi:enamine deaminase RidA (YjgF/YER057c/UK114 family)
MIEKLVRNDTPQGLVFPLGYRVRPGSRLAFLASSALRHSHEAVGGFAEQTTASLAFMRGAAAQVHPAARVTKIRRHMTSGRGHRSPAIREQWDAAFGNEPPSSTALEMPGSPLLGSLIDLEAWVIAPEDSSAPVIQRLPSSNRLEPIAVVLRGDQKLTPAIANPKAAGTPEQEMLSCLDDIDRQFSASGAGPRDVLKLSVYFRDPRLWPVLKAMVIGRYGVDCPVIQHALVSNLERPESHVRLTGWARTEAATGPGPIVSLRDQLLALSGTGAISLFIGRDAKTFYEQLPAHTIEEQAHVAMKNQKAILEAAGATFDHVFRSNWYVIDIREWDAIRPVAESYFGRPLPMPMVVETARLTAKPGVRFEPDLWASIPS